MKMNWKTIKRIRLTQQGKVAATVLVLAAAIAFTGFSISSITDSTKASAIALKIDSVDGIEYVSFESISKAFPDMKVKYDDLVTTLTAKDFKLVADESMTSMIVLNGKEIGLNNTMRTINNKLYIEYSEFLEILKSTNYGDLHVTAIPSYNYDVNKSSIVNEYEGDSIYEDTFYVDTEYGDDIPQAVMKHGSPEDVETVIIDGVIYKKAKLISK